jgi:hypothetical protein
VSDREKLSEMTDAVSEAVNAIWEQFGIIAAIGVVETIRTDLKYHYLNAVAVQLKGQKKVGKKVQP